MLGKSRVAFLALSLVVLSHSALGRMRWMERNDRPVLFNPRRFGQENPPVLAKLAAACPSSVCRTLAGQAITPLLAAQPECSQQYFADSIIDASAQFDDQTQDAMIAIAQEYRQAERNTPPDFTVRPASYRNSVFCQKAPKNAQLNGLVQAQDPSNNPNVFFDPATQQSVQKGAQANTFPFASHSTLSVQARSNVDFEELDESEEVEEVEDFSDFEQFEEYDESDEFEFDTSSDASNFSVPSGSPSAIASAVTVVATVVSRSGSGTISSPTAAVTVAVGEDGDIGNFGSCSVPQVEFATGFDGRKETSFQPADKTSFNHDSVDNIDIITKYICDTLTNTCDADQTAKDTCVTAQAAADAQTAKTGAQADAFNAAFGIETNFASVAEVDDQGNVVSAGSSPATAKASSASATAPTVQATPSAKATSSIAASAASTASVAQVTAAASASPDISDFGSCSVPQIQFGVGFDNRKETSFEPIDQKSFDHGSADDIDIITQFICDTLTNSCSANEDAKNTCNTAKAAADAQTAQTGAQADAFNAVFGIKTSFANIQAIDDKGNVVAGTGSTGAAQPAQVAPSPVVQATPAIPSPSPSSGIGSFGSCSVPQIKFGVGFDGRKETSFEPVDQKSFSHGSADNINVITQFICDTLTNTCKADPTAKNTCKSAQAAADATAAGTGAQADAFNAALGIKTNFAAVTEIDNQGKVVAA